MNSSFCLGAAALIFGAVSATAMPMAVPGQAQSDIAQAAAACSPGWARNAMGLCSPIKRAFVPPPANYRPPLYRPQPWPPRPVVKTRRP